MCVCDCVSACASVIGAVAHQCLTNPLSIFTSVLLVGSQENRGKLHLEASALDISLKKLDCVIV